MKKEMAVKLNENVREEKQEDGKTKLFIKKNDIWWPAHKNDDGEVYPDLFAIGDDYEIIHNNLKKMLVNLERSGVKEIDFSNWVFTNVYFDGEIMKLMEFADRINLQNADFTHVVFCEGQMKNADFSRASFDMSQVIDSTFHNCNFSKTIWYDPADGDMSSANAIKKSVFTSCKFEYAQLNNTESSENKFFACNFRGVNEQRKSIRDKLSGYLQEVKSRNADWDVKQHDHRQEER